MIDPATDQVVQQLVARRAQELRGPRLPPGDADSAGRVRGLVRFDGAGARVGRRGGRRVDVLAGDACPRHLGVAFATPPVNFALGGGAAVRRPAGPTRAFTAHARQLQPERSRSPVRSSTSSPAGRCRSGWRRRSISGSRRPATAACCCPTPTRPCRASTSTTRAAPARRPWRRGVRPRHGERSAAARGRLVLTPGPDAAAMSDRPDRSRRAAVAACLGAPLAAAAALSGRVRTALVGARGFTDSRAPPRRLPENAARAGRRRTGADRAPRAGSRRPISRADELLAALVAPDRVVGVSAYADDPATSNCHDAYPPTIPRLRSDPETVIALAPDLVCVAGFTAADPLRLLVGAGLPVVALVALRFVRGRDGEIRLMGAVVGEDARADALAGGIAALLADLERRLAGVRRGARPLLRSADLHDGRGTLVDEILTRAGGENVVRGAGHRRARPDRPRDRARARAGGDHHAQLRRQHLHAARARRRRDLAPGPGRPRRPCPRDPRLVDRDGVTSRRAGPLSRRAALHPEAFG